MTNPVIDEAARQLATKPPSVRAYLTRHQEQIAQHLASALADGKTKREFWSALADELSRAGVLGNRGRMSWKILYQAWGRLRPSKLERITPPPADRTSEREMAPSVFVPVRRR